MVSYLPVSQPKNLKGNMRELFVFIFMIVSGVPVAIFGGFPLSISDITVAILLCAYVLFFNDFSFSPHVKFVFLSMAISIVLILLAIIFGIKDSPAQMVLSYINYYKFCLSYVLGYLLICNLNILMKYCRGTFLILSFVYVVCILYDSNIFSNNGLSFFGIRLYGTKGVNAGFVYLTTSLMLYLVFAGETVRSRIVNTFSGLLVLVAICMIFYSSSRQAIIGCLIFVYFYCSTRLLRGFVLLFILVVVLMSVGLPDYFVAKMSIKFDSFVQYDFETFSAGRIAIYQKMILDVIQNPIIGSLFSGFSADTYLLLLSDRNSGLSPHNQYLGALWKMGGLAVIPYYIFLVKVFFDFRKLYRLNRDKVTKLLYYFCVIVYVVFLNTQDYLLFSLTGNMFMFISGGVANMLYRNKSRTGSSYVL